MNSEFFLLLLIKACIAENILAIFPFPGLSHFRMFESVVIELASRGHNVDVFSHFPSNITRERYQEISIKGSAKIVTSTGTISKFRRTDHAVFLTKAVSLEYGSELCGPVFNTVQLQELKNSKKRYDLVITELFGTDCMLGWSWYFDVPSVVITSSVIIPWASDRFGLPDNPAYIPNIFTPYLASMTLYERILNTWTLLLAKFLYRFYSTEPSDTAARQFFGKNMPNLDDLVYNTSLYLVNSHFSINNVRPLLPNVVEVAGLHIKDSRHLKLPEYFEKILSNDKRGVICFTLGSVIQAESIPKETLQQLMNAFAELPSYKVLFKMNKEKLPNDITVPQNIQFESWMPQQELLCDQRVKLFISHGGLMSTQEATHCGIPVLGIPLFADQELNLKHIEALGFGITVKYEDISKEAILSAATELLENPKYEINAKKVSEQFTDRPMSAIDTAIYWIEYVIRYKGAPQLRSTAAKLFWYQYYLLDVIILSVIIPILLLIATLKALRKIICKVIYSVNYSKAKKLKTK